MPKIPYNDEIRAESSIKSLNFELSNLSPSHLVALFEIDLNELLEQKGMNLQAQATAIGIGTTGSSMMNVNDGILRFHNDTKALNSFIIWRGKTYYPAPITAEGFESSSKGTLPQPTLTIASQSENGVDQLALLKHQIREFGDIIGSKVTRRRTFAKYLDRANFAYGGVNLSEKAQQLPQGYEPDPYAQLPEDIYFIERKQAENKSTITYQLSSVLDTEGSKLPKRVIVSDKCVWQYRGIGCWYQHAEKEREKAADGSNLNYNDPNFPPILKKAELSKLGDSTGYGLPKESPPVANDKDEKIRTLLNINGSMPDLGPWKSDQEYKKGNTVYILKDKIKYYFVAKATNEGQIPPNSDFWIADECSKSLTGCRLRWGKLKGNANTEGCSIKKGELPFGGFPAARKIQNS